MKTKYLLFLMLILSFFLALPIISSAQTYNISIPDISVPATQSQVTVPIIVAENLSGQNITSYQGIITWNNNVIQYSNHVHAGTLTEPWGTSGWTQNPSSGSLNFGQFVTQPALTGSGTIVNLIFNIVGQSGDNTTISFNSFYLNAFQAITANGSVTIQSTTPNSDIDVVPSSWDYGNVNLGNTPEKTFLISNTGGATLNVSGASITGTNANQFSIVSGGGSFNISAGGSHNLTVRFAPTSTGSKSATLRINSNDPDENPKDVVLTGTGTQTPPPKPTVTTTAATNITSSSAQLNGTVNPNGASTTYYFQYGLTTSYGSTTSSVDIGSGTSAISVNRSITGLNANTTYHYRIVATNSGGTSNGTDLTFVTLPTSTVAMPTFSPLPKYYTSPQNVSLSCATNGATIRYTINGTDPTESSSIYTSPILVNSTMTIKARGYLSGWTPSNVATGVYTIIMPPNFFDDFEDGIADGWLPNTPIRWSVVQDEGDYSYFLNSTGYNGGERTLIQDYSFNNFELTVKIKSAENLNQIINATYTIHFCYLNEDNYYSVKFCQYSPENKLYRKKDGQSIELDSFNGSTIKDNDYHEVKIKKDGNNILVYFDQQQIMSATDNSLSSGQIGLGAWQNSAYFDDVLITTDDQLPDLICTNHSFSPTELRPPNAINLSGYIYNQGNAATGNEFQVNFYLSTSSSQVDYHYFVHYFEVQPLGIKQGVSFNEVGEVPSDVPPDYYYVWICVNAYAKVPESNFENNQKSSSSPLHVLSPINPEPLVITAPNGNETWAIKSTQTITWTSSGTSGNVKIELSRNGGSTWELIFPNTPDDHSQTWTVTGPISSNCKIKITDVDGSPSDMSDNPFTISGPDIASTPTSWNYGSVDVSTNADKTFVITNEGNANLSVTATTLTGTNASEFSIQSGGGAFSLAPSATRNMVVRFNPTSAGSKNASLSISSNDPDENPLVVSLSGTATTLTVPDIAVNPTSWSYGSVNVGSNSDKTFVITNEGTANLSVTATTLTGTNASEFGIQNGGGAFTLAPATTRNLVVRFTPTSAGSKNASLTISSNDPDENPLLVPLTGTGIESTVPDIAIAPTSWSYGSITVGSSSDKTFVVKNEGTASLSVTNTTLTGVNISEFIIQRGGGAFTLAPSATRDIVISFSPTSAGSKTATLSISSNDPNENPLTASLSGTGISVSASPIFPSSITTTQMVGSEFWINIDIGTSSKPVSNLFGVSFDLNFSHTTYLDVVTPHATSVIPGSFLGNDIIFFQNVDESGGKVSIGNTRKAGQGGVNGYGTVAQIKFIANASTPNNTLVQFSIANVDANNASGTSIPLEPGTLTVTIVSGLIVWPGDTNNDKIVNQADVLPLGLHYGKTGPARQNASNSWLGQFATPWNPEPATFANANGDGTINQADVLAIGLNWNKTHTIALGKPEIATAQTNQSNIANLTVTINGDTNPDKNFFIDVFANNVTNLFGLSFELIYTPTAFVDPQTAEAGINNLLGNDLIFFPMMNKNAGIDSGKVSIGISRKSGQGGVTGTGLVTRITAHMASNALSGTSTTRLSLQNIVANDPNGNPIAIDTSFINLVTHVEDQLTTMPSGMVLGDNYPNPFNAATTIDYQLSQPAEVVLTIYDVQGHEVSHLVKAKKSAGCHSVLWDGRDQAGNLVASGIYFYRLNADRFNETKKCVLMK